MILQLYTSVMLSKQVSGLSFHETFQFQNYSVKSFSPFKYSNIIHSLINQSQIHRSNRSSNRSFEIRSVTVPHHIISTEQVKESSVCSSKSIVIYRGVCPTAITHARIGCRFLVTQTRYYLFV